MDISLTNVFLLWHTHNLTDDCGTHEEVKLIGVFSSAEKANEAMEQLKNKEGFRDFPISCFEIAKIKIGQTSWIDGFLQLTIQNNMAMIEGVTLNGIKPTSDV